MAPSEVPKATVIIPTRNAGPLFEGVMQAVASQDYHDYEILVVDTSSTDRTRDIARKHGARIYTVTQDEFSHGGTRNLAARLARGEVIAFLSQDATPAKKSWLRELASPLKDRNIAGVFGGQIPREEASPMERFFYSVRFPDKPKKRSLARGSPISLDHIFFSNVNSAMRRDMLLSHPFDNGIIMSEDQEWAKRVLLDGFKTLYEPSAAVIHSHNYTLKTAFQRYFDSAYSLMEVTDDTFRNFTKAGFSYTLDEFRYVMGSSPTTVPYLFLYDFSKVAGTFLGRQAKKLPRRLCEMMSLHKYHWARQQ